LNYLLTHSILRSAEHYPDKDAFRCGKQTLTYAGLLTRINQLAGTLHDLGVRPGDRVGIFMNRCLDTAIAIYGIMNAGAVYVPIDPNLPEERVRFLLHDCQIEHLVSNQVQNRKLAIFDERPAPLKTIIGLKVDWNIHTVSWEEVDQMPDRLPKVNLLEQDPAYILYTSGSTGKPKGILHTHYSGLSYAKLSSDLYQLQATDVIGNHAPIFFDISTLGYFSSPFVGATTIITSDAHVMMPASLAQLIAQERVSIWYSVPLALVQMLQLGVLDKHNYSQLRWLLYAGEPFPIKHLRHLMQTLPHTSFSNVYGPTEVNQCTYYTLPDIPAADQVSIPLGQVWNNTEMLIVDDSDQEVPRGESGELLIRSATMMKGYWNDPERTAQSLFKRTGKAGLEEVFYRTGDLVVLNEQEELLFLGRKDRQVKTRGFRVELDDVEAAMLTHEAIDEAAVFAVKGEDEINTIFAVVKCKAPLVESDLFAFLKTKLPAYAVPAKVSIMDDLPRTPTGKINRNYLKDMTLLNKIKPDN
jgi:amino acid adenylation domain-containing protein